TVSDGTTTCIGTVAAGQCSLTSANTGVKSVTASYATDGNFNSSTSAAVNHTVDARTTSTSVSCTSPVPFGSSSTCTVTVTDTSPGTPITPTGTASWTASGAGVAPTGANCTLTSGTCTANFT